MISGHRRFNALKAQGEPTIPCFIRDDISDRDLPYIKLIENIQRKQYRPHELVEIFDEMIANTPGLTKNRIAVMIGKSDSWVLSRYKLAAIYNEMLDQGYDEETLSDFSDADLRRLTRVGDKSERKKVAKNLAAAPKGKKDQIIEKARSYIKPKKYEKSKAMIGGFDAYHSGEKQIIVICKTKGLRSRVSGELSGLQMRYYEEAHSQPEEHKEPVRLFTQAKCQEVMLTWPRYRKRKPVRAMRVDGQFECRYRGRTLRCEDGYVVVGRYGNPYPLEKEEFEELYEEEGK
nr:hypothetical protein 16 [bacterium]